MSDSLTQSVDSASINLQWARWYVTQRNWSVFPADVEIKKGIFYEAHPLTPGRKWGQTKDLVQLDAIADAFRYSRIGIATGEQGGIFVLDIDTVEGHDVDGRASLAALEAKHGKLPDTLTAESPSGSLHYYFRWPGFSVTSSTGKLDPKTGQLQRGAVALGIDVKGDRGMVIAPPSVNTDGRAYKWLNDLPIAAAPPWLIDHLRKHSTGNRNRSPKGTVTTIAAPVGHRPAQGTQAARVLADECARLAEMQEGDLRSLGLTMAAKAIGKFVAIGEIAEDVGIHDLLQAAKKCGAYEKHGVAQCKSKIRNGFGYGAQEPAKPATEMFHNAIPTTSAGPAGAIPMLGGTLAIVEIGTPIVNAFNAANAVEHDIRADTVLPLEVHCAPLRLSLTEAIGKMLTLASKQRAAMRFDTVGPVLALLSAAHAPAFDAVVSLIRATGAVLPEGRLKSAVRGFEAEVQRATRTGQGWITDSKGYPDARVSENVDVLLSTLNADLRFNVFGQRIEFQRKSEPWMALEEDRDLSLIHYEANSAAHRFHISYGNLRSSIVAIARRRTYDPLVDYLDSLVWDGTPRLDKWISIACGVPNDAYHAAVGRNVVGGLVKRARRPGAKHDEVMLLMGEQGGTKSGLVSALMPDPDWFAETLNIKQKSQDLIPEISGKWLVEWSELAGKGKTEIEDVKAFISRRTDRYTAKFEKIAADHPRRAIFVATTNSAAPLRDETGNRRFLPVRVPAEIDVAWLEANRDQLFAEASVLDAAGERFGVPRELWGTAGEHQESAREKPLYEIMIAEWFSGRSETPYYVTSGDLQAALQRAGVRANAIGDACKRVGLEKKRTNKIPDFWITKGADEKTTPRVRLNELRSGDVHSRVAWQWPPAAPCPLGPVPY